MVRESGFEVGDIPEERFDGNADLKTVQTACLNFGKDRFDILRSLSRQDIQILVGYGCPSADKKVVMAAKLLRKHVHLDEGDVCSSCNLRSSCEKAYLLTNKEDEARTIDIVRVLSTFGLDHAHGLVTNKSLLKQKSVKIVVRKLLHQIIKLSAVPIDPNLPPPVIKRPPPKVKQPPPTPKRRVGRDDVEMKKGDWLCPKCDFMNFAKNTVCLQCDAKRPKRQLLPGEWECPECNFLNYRRNTACFHCDCKRPPDQFMEDKLQERRQNPRTRLERTASRPEVSNAWNFDFDDDESDGADVAAFEYADLSMKGEDSSLHSLEQGRNHRGFEDNFHRNNKFPRVGDREYSDSDHGSRAGFDDFDDEEDDVDSYELETRNNQLVRNGSSIDFSEVERESGSEDGDLDKKSLAREKPRSLSPNRPLKPLRHRRSVPGSYDDEVDFDSEDETSVRPNWRSSHVADSRNRGKSRSPPGKFRGLSYGSDEEAGLYSDSTDDSDEDQRMWRSKAGKFSDKVVRQRNSRLSGFESDDYTSSHGTKFRRKGTYPNRTGSKFDGRGSRSNRSNFSDDDFDRPSRGARGGIKSRGPRVDEFSGRWNDRRSDGPRNYKSPPRAGKFENNQRGRFNKYKDDRGGGGGSDDFRNRRRVIER
ncbi:hypothetical protein NL676_030807 [Syzygium grande]|nr:hypothetical protein NL676_030807 [Syzygium grande]